MGQQIKRKASKRKAAVARKQRSKLKKDDFIIVKRANVRDQDPTKVTEEYQASFDYDLETFNSVYYKAESNYYASLDYILDYRSMNCRYCGDFILLQKHYKYSTVNEEYVIRHMDNAILDKKEKQYLREYQKIKKAWQRESEALTVKMKHENEVNTYPNSLQRIFCLLEEHDYLLYRALILIADQQWFLFLLFGKIMDRKSQMATFKLTAIFASKHDPSKLICLWEFLMCSRILSQHLNYQICDFICSSKKHLEINLEHGKELILDSTEATLLPQDLELKTQCVLQLVDLHYRIPEIQRHPEGWTSSITLSHIITYLIKILNVKGFQAEGFFKYDKWKCFVPSYTIFDSTGEACMIFKFNELSLPSYKLSENKAIDARKSQAKDLISPFIREMIKEKVSFGALMVRSSAIMIELDLEKFEIEKNQKRVSISDFPYKYHIGREDHAEPITYLPKYAFPSYLQLLLAWMIKSLKQSEVKRYEMDRLHLEELNGLEASDHLDSAN